MKYLGACLLAAVCVIVVYAQSNNQASYIAYGDSLTFGIEGGDTPYPPLYARWAQVDLGKSVTLDNKGSRGAMSKTIRDWFDDPHVSSSYHSANKKARFITLNVGFNDLVFNAWHYYKAGSCGGSDGQDCYRSAVSNFKANWDAILSAIEASCNPQGTSVVVWTVYDPFVAMDEKLDSFHNDGGLNDHEVTKKYFKELNDHIKQSAASYGFGVADVYERFNGADGEEDPVAKGYLDYDNVHLGDRGNVVVAEELRAQDYEPNCYGAS